MGSDSGSVNYALGLGDTEGVDSERAETHLRLVAEAELRRATMIPTDGARQWHAQRLVLVAQVLSAVGAIDAYTADEIQSDIGLALMGRRPFRGRHQGVPCLRSRYGAPSGVVARSIVARGAGRKGAPDPEWGRLP